jgi:hypothetical protein
MSVKNAAGTASKVELSDVARAAIDELNAGGF